MGEASGQWSMFAVAVIVECYLYLSLVCHGMSKTLPASTIIYSIYFVLSKLVLIKPKDFIPIGEFYS